MIDQRRQSLLEEVCIERKAQDEKWGGPEHDDEHIQMDWQSYIREHTSKASDLGKFRKQMVRVAALALAAIESHDRKNAAAPTDISGERQREAVEVLREALNQVGCDGDLCLYAWHEKARRIIEDADDALAAPQQTTAAQRE
jgi:hypothetical protein